MSRKDYIALAAAMLLIPDLQLRARVAAEIAYWCKLDNSSFDRTKFFMACGL